MPRACRGRMRDVPSSQPTDHSQMLPVSPSTRWISPGVQLSPGPQSMSSTHSPQMPRRSQSMNGVSVQLPDAQALAPLLGSQPCPLGSEPSSTHSHWPRTSGTLGLGWQVSPAMQSMSSMQSPHVPISRAPSSKSRMTLHSSPGMHAAEVWQPEPKDPSLHAAGSNTKALAGVQPPPGQSASSSHSPQRPMYGPVSWQVPDSHSSS